MDDVEAGASGAFAGHRLLSFAASSHAALDTLDRDAWGVAEGDLPGLVRSVGSLLDRVSAVLVSVVAEADARDLPARHGATSTAVWVRELLNVTVGAATELVITARAVRSDLTATGEALAAGTIGYAHAATITRAVAALPADLSVAGLDAGGAPDPDAPPVPVRVIGEGRLLREAQVLDARQVDKIGQHLLAAIAPEIGEAAEAEALRRQEERDREARHLTWSVDRHGAMRFSGHLDPEAAQTVKAAIDALSAPHPVDGQRDGRTAGRRRGDALHEVCRRSLDAGDLPDQGGAPPQVVVHIPLRTLVDGLGPAAYQDGVRISPGLARKLACCAMIIPAVLGGESAVLDLGRATRLFTGARRRAVTLRDKGCAFPGCDRPPAWCDGHHIVAVHHGGPTDIANGVLLCEHHHHVIHHGDWTIVMTPDGIPEFIPPPWIDPEQTPRRNTRHR